MGRIVAAFLLVSSRCRVPFRRRIRWRELSHALVAGVVCRLLADFVEERGNCVSSFLLAAAYHSSWLCPDTGRRVPAPNGFLSLNGSVRLDTNEVIFWIRSADPWSEYPLLIFMFRGGPVKVEHPSLEYVLYRRNRLQFKWNIGFWIGKCRWARSRKWVQSTKENFSLFLYC